MPRRCHGRHGARSWRTLPTALPACQHPHPCSLAYYNLEEFESALDAFQAAADLEPDKMIHKSWLNMCRVQLGGERAAAPNSGQAPSVWCDAQLMFAAMRMHAFANLAAA